jgi:hypothetical protein
MKRLLSVALLVLAAAPARGQSCPAADSVVGPQIHRGGIARHYEQVTDTTQLEVREDVVRLISSSPDASFRLISAFEGQTPSATPSTTLHIVMAVDRHGGLTDQQMSTEQSRMYGAENAAVLLDNTTRLRLPRAAYNAAVQQANLVRGTRLLEDAAYSIPPDQLKALATAHRVEIVAGPVRGGFSGARLTAIKELYRLGVCAGGETAASSAGAQAHR